MPKDGCPHCGNKAGFAFGCCIDCGFNYLTNKFEIIRVSVSDLPHNYRAVLIAEHARRTHDLHRHEHSAFTVSAHERYLNCPDAPRATTSE